MAIEVSMQNKEKGKAILMSTHNIILSTKNMQNKKCFLEPTDSLLQDNLLEPSDGLLLDNQTWKTVCLPALASIKSEYKINTGWFISNRTILQWLQ